MDKAVLDAISYQQIGKRNILAAQILLIYDALLCADREYKYIWKAKWSLGKVLYLLTRYIPLIINSGTAFSPKDLGPDPSPKFCKVVAGLEAYAGVVEYGLFQSTIALRAYALHQGAWWAKWFLVITLLLTVGGYLTLNILWIPSFTYIRNPLNGVIPGCIPALSDCAGCRAYMDWWFIAVLVSNLVIFLTTLVAVIQNFRVQARTRLLKMVYRDGILYFAVIFSMNLVQFIVWNVAPSSTFGILYGYARSLDAMLCCRLFLNLRGALTKPSEYSSGAKHGTALESLSLTTIAFVTVTSEDTPNTSVFSTYNGSPIPNTSTVDAKVV